VAHHGENQHTIQLCPNCHDLCHIIQAKTRKAGRLLGHYLRAKGTKFGDDPSCKFLIGKIVEAESLHEHFAADVVRVYEAVWWAIRHYVRGIGVEVVSLFALDSEQEGDVLRCRSR
jgi:hypothetical protein